MLSLVDWSAFLPAAVLVSLVPGANQVLSLQHGARWGRGPALWGLVGRFGGFLVHLTLVVVGLSTLLIRSAVAFEVIRWAGVVYLTWLGIQALRSGGATDEPAQSSTAPWRRELLTALTNPKALLLFAAFVPQFVDRSAGGVGLAVVGLAYIAVEAVTATAYVLLGERVARYLRDRRARRRLDRGSGVAYLGLAGWLALERRPAG